MNLQFPLTPDHAARLLLRACECAGRFAEFNPDQPRDERGQWTSTGNAPTGETFYHGTSRSRLESILKDGLQVSRVGESYSQSKKNSVYLGRTEKEARFWANTQVNKEQIVGQPRKDFVILKVSIPISELGKVSPDKQADSDDAVKFKGDIKPEWIVEHKVGSSMIGRGLEAAVTVFVAVVFDEEEEPRSAARHPESAIHAAADRFIPRLSVAFRHAFAMGRKAVRATRDADKAADAVKATLGQTLHKALLAVVAAGGDVAAEALRSMRAAEFNPDQPRDEEGKWTDGGSSTISASSLFDRQTFVHGSTRRLDDLQPGTMFSDDPVWAAGYTTHGEKDEIVGNVHTMDLPKGPTITVRSVHQAEGRLIEIARDFSKKEPATLREAAEIVAKNTDLVAILAKSGGSVTGGVLIRGVPVTGRANPKDVLKEARIRGKEIPSNLRGAEFNPDQPRDERGQWTDGGPRSYAGPNSIKTRSDLEDLANTAALTVKWSAEDPNYDYYTHVTRRSVEPLVKEGVKPGQAGYVSMSQGIIRPFGDQSEYVVVRVPKGEATSYVDRVEPGLSYPEFRVQRLIEPKDIVRVIRTVDGMREDDTARAFLEGRVSESDLARLPKSYRAWKMRSAEFNPDQPRDEGGRWTDTGGGSATELPWPHAPGQTHTFGRIDKSETTESFRTWFKDSKASDADGNPIVLYKAMYPYDYRQETSEGPGPLIESIDRPSLFPSFDPNDQEPVKLAGFFGSREVADRFALGAGKGQAIFPVVLSLQNPKVIDAKGRPAGLIQFEKTGRSFRDAIRSGKFDGIIIRNTSDEGDVYVALKPEQIKSAIGITKREIDPKSRGLEGSFRSLKPRPQTKVRFRFDATNPHTVRWAKRHAADLISEVSDTTRKRVRKAVEDLVKGEADWNLMLDQIEDAVGDLDRAELIARNEVMVAANEGQRQAWGQAVEEGLLPEDAQRVWITVGDDKVCPICEPLDGKMAGLDDDYDDDITGPPAHVSCRCTEGISG